MSKVDGMTPEEAAVMILNALGDRPSGPDPRKVLAVIQAQAWDEAVSSLVYEDGEDVEIISNDNPYRSQA